MLPVAAPKGVDATLLGVGRSRADAPREAAGEGSGAVAPEPSFRWRPRLGVGDMTPAAVPGEMLLCQVGRLPSFRNPQRMNHRLTPLQEHYRASAVARANGPLEGVPADYDSCDPPAHLQGRSHIPVRC